MQIIQSSQEIAALAKDTAYQQAVAKKLDAALERTRQQGNVFTVDHAAARLIIFSDLHRGIRDRADDHRHCERAYNAALAYYYGMGHALITLGDVDELWEEKPDAILRAYRHSISLEARFNQEGRYLRFWGNHDEDWNNPRRVQHKLDPLYVDPQKGGAPLTVREGLLIEVTEGDQKLGDLFLVHGHQGTIESDRFAKISRFFVRTFWRPIQNLLGITANKPANIPSQNWQLRAKHDIALYRWAASQKRMVLIAGHTHRPVFQSKSHAAKIEGELEILNSQLKQNPSDGNLREKVALLMAELEWVRAQEGEQTSGPEGAVVPMKTPCYFNSGCCCFTDGDITGIEIADGMIRLVHFPTKDGKPRPQVLEENSLKNVLLAS
jgi:hypothetical protein